MYVRLVLANTTGCYCDLHLGCTYTANDISAILPKMLKTRYPWELIQIGNGGSPIETPEGWLVITHGVGPIREYTLGASLFDLENPKKEIGRLRSPLQAPNAEEREGYVPNVVYSCGSMIHNDEQVIPYAMSDYASTYAIVNLRELLNELKNPE